MEPVAWNHRIRDTCAFFVINRRDKSSNWRVQRYLPVSCSIESVDDRPGRKRSGKRDTGTHLSKFDDRRTDILNPIPLG